MPASRRCIAVALALLLFTILACQQSPRPSTPILTVSPGTGTPPAPEDTAFPTVTPLAFGTANPMPGSTLTTTVTPEATETPGITATPARLELGPEDISYSLSPKRPEDGKVQLTMTLHPRGGQAPYSFSIDGGPTISGLSYTFDWHNCGQSEPHTVTLFSGDGQKTRPVGFIPLYEC